jgi:hypothetical protein
MVGRDPRQSGHACLCIDPDESGVADSGAPIAAPRPESTSPDPSPSRERNRPASAAILIRRLPREVPRGATSGARADRARPEGGGILEEDLIK